jgi:hypothetical protein
MRSILGRVVAVTYSPTFALVVAAIVVLLTTTVATIACASCPPTSSGAGGCGCANVYTVNPVAPLLLLAAFVYAVAVTALWFVRGTSPLAWIVDRPRPRPRGGMSPR